ncbi:MAG: hypothetical protein LC115_09335 [Bacteroidia bacterium]|nr:hypothetical protein [Bacteroidia bacterium]
MKHLRWILGLGVILAVHFSPFIALAQGNFIERWSYSQTTRKLKKQLVRPNTLHNPVKLEKILATYSERYHHLTEKYRNKPKPYYYPRFLTECMTGMAVISYLTKKKEKTDYFLAKIRKISHPGDVKVALLMFEAKMLLDEQRFDEAIAKIEYAKELNQNVEMSSKQKMYRDRLLCCFIKKIQNEEVEGCYCPEKFKDFFNADTHIYKVVMGNKL